MAKQPKESKQSANDDLGIVTSDAVQGKARGVGILSHKFILIGVIVILVAAGGSAWYWQAHRSATTDNAGAVNQLTPQQKAVQSSQSLALNGDYTGAQAALDTQIAAATNPTDKGQFYETKASNALNEQKYADAKSFAEQAEKLHPTSNSAYLIAAAAEGLGDKTTAVMYYQKALDRLDSVTKQRAPDIAQMYQDKIKELSS